MLLLGLALFLGPSRAAATSGEVLGGHEGWLDRMGGGIRELGMGNTGTASEEAAPAAYWNPALLPFNRVPVVSAGADMRSLNRNGGYAGIQGRVASNLGMGLGILNRGDYHVQAYDENEKDIGIARPQSIATYVGVGLKTSRGNAFGAAIQWYSANQDLGGTGDVNVIGIVNLGWYKRWGKLQSAVVIRNLGLNSDLSAKFDQTTVDGEEDLSGFDHTTTDFFPKTLVVAVNYPARAFGKTWDLAAEILDYQLKDKLYALDANFHAQGFRAGLDCHLNDAIRLRGGFDRGNLSLGFGYLFPWGKRTLAFDYALVLEKGWLTVNPITAGFRFDL